MSSDTRAGLFAQMVTELDPRARTTRQAVYSALITWEDSLDENHLPSMTDLSYRTPRATSTLTDALGPDKYKHLHLSNPPLTGPARAVQEAKEVTLAPHIIGWLRQSRALNLQPLQQAETLVRTIAVWGIQYSRLAMMAPTRLPIASTKAIGTVTKTIPHPVPDDDSAHPADRFACLLRDAIQYAATTATITPATVLSRYRAALHDLGLGLVDLERESLQLISNVGGFMQAAQQNPASVHPDLHFVLQRAANQLRGTATRDTPES